MNQAEALQRQRKLEAQERVAREAEQREARAKQVLANRELKLAQEKARKILAEVTTQPKQAVSLLLCPNPHRCLSLCSWRRLHLSRLRWALVGQEAAADRKQRAAKAATDRAEYERAHARLAEHAERHRLECAAALAIQYAATLWL